MHASAVHRLESPDAPPMHACRRLPALVAPALEPELAALLARLAAAFPPVEACLAASGTSAPDAPGALSGSRSGVGDPGNLGVLAGSDSEGDGAHLPGSPCPVPGSASGC